MVLKWSISLSGILGNRSGIVDARRVVSIPMAQRPLNLFGRSTAAPPGMFQRRRSRVWFTVLAGLATALYPITALLCLPRHVPPVPQAMLAVGFVVLAMVTFLWASRPKDLSPEVLERLRHLSHNEFAQQFRAIRAQQHRKIKIPGVGRISLRSIGGTLVLLGSTGWWLSPWAPVLAQRPVIEDQTDRLGEDLTAVMLVLFDDHVALAQPPILPPDLRKLAGRVRDDARPYQLALRALVRADFAEARRRLAEVLDDEDSDKPLLYVTLAQVEMYAGRFGDAVAAYDKALKLAPNRPDWWCELAAARLQAGQFDLAKPALDKAARLCRDNRETTHREAAVCEHLRSLLAIDRCKDFDEAVKQIEDARGHCKAAVGEEGLLVAANLNNQAVLFALRANYTGAQELLTVARRIVSAPPGQYAIHAVGIQASLAAILLAQAKYDEANTMLGKAEATPDQALPDDHPGRLALLNLRALLDEAQGHYDEAQAGAEQALVHCEKNLGVEHPCAAPIVDGLALIRADRGRHAQAYQASFRAVTLVKKLWGAEHPFLALDLKHQADICILKQNYTEGETVAQQAEAVCVRSFAKRHPSLAGVLCTRGRLAILQDRPRDAKKPLARARDIWETVYREHPDLAMALGEQASLARNGTGVPEGIEQYQRAMEMMERFVGPEHPEIARLLCGQAALWLVEEKNAEAAACLDRALTIQEKLQEKVLGKNHPDLAATLDLYAAALAKTTPPDPGRAAEMTARAKDILAKHEEEDRVEPGPTK